MGLLTRTRMSRINDRTPISWQEWPAKEGGSRMAFIDWSPVVTKQEVFDWLQCGVFSIVDGQVYTRSGRRLIQRINKRRRCDHGDPRVDLCHDGRRASVNVSHLVWMWNAKSVLPDRFEIHHRDEDCTNNEFNNLIAVHPVDHAKLHAFAEEPVPF